MIGAYKTYQLIRYTEASKYRVARSMRDAPALGLPQSAPSKSHVHRYNSYHSFCRYFDVILTCSGVG